MVGASKQAAICAQNWCHSIGIWLDSCICLLGIFPIDLRKKLQKNDLKKNDDLMTTSLNVVGWQGKILKWWSRMEGLCFQFRGRHLNLKKSRESFAVKRVSNLLELDTLGSVSRKRESWTELASLLSNQRQKPIVRVKHKIMQSKYCFKLIIFIDGYVIKRIKTSPPFVCVRMDAKRKEWGWVGMILILILGFIQYDS